MCLIMKNDNCSVDNCRFEYGCDKCEICSWNYTTEFKPDDSNREV